MSQEDISPSVRAFITEHIDSVMELELLLLLQQRSQRAWTPAQLAAELRIDAAWVSNELARLRAFGLLASADASSAVTFAPRTPELRQAVLDLAAVYNDRRVTVIGLIFSKPTEKIRSFADAFRLRKDNTDG